MHIIKIYSLINHNNNKIAKNIDIRVKIFYRQNLSKSNNITVIYNDS